MSVKIIVWFSNVTPKAESVEKSVGLGGSLAKWRDHSDKVLSQIVRCFEV